MPFGGGNLQAEAPRAMTGVPSPVGQSEIGAGTSLVSTDPVVGAADRHAVRIRLDGAASASFEDHAVHGRPPRRRNRRCRHREPISAGGTVVATTRADGPSEKRVVGSIRSMTTHPCMMAM